VLLSSLFFPRTCPFCGRYISDRQIREEHIEWICVDCWLHLPRTEQDYLRENSTETTLTDGIVSRQHAMHLERAWAYLFYEKDHPIQRVIHRMKYADEPELGFWLARQAVLDTRHEEFFDDIDVIVPMPLHPRRLRERGYNQAEYIARGLSEITGIPVDTTHVTRARNTPKQALQDGEGRRTNVAKAFAVNHPEQMYNKHILVVDDLITTGETVKSCLHAMKRFRGARFSVFALCKAR
jgi:ComF family protein